VSRIGQLLAILFLGVVSHPAVAYMGGGTRVLIGQGQDPSGFELRIRAELEAAGFTVLIVPIDMRGDPRRELDIASRREEAGAAILCLSAMGYVEIWIADRVTGKVVLRHVQIPVGADDADSFVALATVELLRASFLEVTTSHRAVQSVKPDGVVARLIAPRPEEKKPEKAPIQRVSIQVSPTVFVSRFDGAPMLDLFMGLDIRFYRQLELAFTALIPLVPSRVESPAGSALVRSGAGGIGLDYSIAKPGRRLRGDTGMGWTLLFYQINGSPAEGYLGHEALKITSSPYLRGGLEVVLATHLRLRIDLIMGVGLSDVKVRMPDGHSASFGHFWFSSGLGLVFGV